MNTRTTTYIALMVALLIVLGFIPGIPLGFIPVPIVLQNLGVMLAGALLGSRKGFLAVAIFLALSCYWCTIFTRRTVRSRNAVWANSRLSADLSICSFFYRPRA